MQTLVKESNKCEQYVRKTRSVRRNWSYVYEKITCGSKREGSLTCWRRIMLINLQLINLLATNSQSVTNCRAYVCVTI